MRNKRFLSTVVATALVVTTMAMPVMAEDGGQVDVDVTTKNAVIRVQVPTSLEVAVNQFEKEDAGSQIYSEEFPITNMSEIPVKMTVDSELVMDGAVKLLPTRKGAVDSTVATGEAWLGVAAQIAANSYVTGDTTKKVEGLTEANKNVTTFVQDETTKTKATAQQVYYLDKAADVSALTYTTFVPKANGKADVPYAQFYKLDPISFTAAADPQNPTSDETAKWQEELDAAIAAGNVYQIATATDTATPTGQALAPTAQGATYAAANTYYTAATSTTAEADLKTNEKYLYTSAAAGGTAAFRYIGKLSEGKATWTESDFSDIHIKYGIVGVTATKYGEVSGNCVQGLYTEPEPLTVTSGKDNTDVALKFDVAGKTLATNYFSINGVDMSSWQTLSSDVAFNASTGVITIKSQVFGYDSISSQTTDHKYTILVKDTDGTSYSTGEVDLTPAP